VCVSPTARKDRLTAPFQVDYCLQGVGSTQYVSPIGIHLTLSYLLPVDYSSTKGAIVTFTRSLAMQLIPRGIRVNGVAPGTIMTALQASSRDAEDVEELGVGKAPLHNRAGQPAEVRLRSLSSGLCYSP
jgi:NAD(P)-dependent dehydrogenase (short-subunit alcohol dehydrogenase family)